MASAHFKSNDVKHHCGRDSIFSYVWNDAKHRYCFDPAHHTAFFYSVTM